MSDAVLRKLERGDEATAEHLLRHGLLVGAQFDTARYGGRGGMHPGRWEVTELTSDMVEFGAVGKSGKLLKAGPGKRYRYALSGPRCFASPLAVLEHLRASLVATSPESGADKAAVANREPEERRDWAVRQWVHDAGRSDYMSDYHAQKEVLVCVVSATTRRRAMAAARSRFGTCFSDHAGATCEPLAESREHIRAASKFAPRVDGN